MKKILSILCAVLVSLAAGASITTQEWTFDNMTAWDSGTASLNAETGVVTANKWRGVGNWGWLEKGDYDKLVVEVADHNYAVLVKVKTINNGEDGDVDENYVNIEKEISAEQNCLVIDLSSSKDYIKYIQLDNWSNYDEVNFTIKRIYLLKTSGIEINRPLWSGNNTFDNWHTGFSVIPFARVYEWDKMVITYTKESNPQCQIKIKETDAYLDFVGAYVDVSGETQASFLLSAADAEAIRTNGMWFNGQDMTIKSVSIVSHRTLSSTEKTMGNWGNYVEIDADKLTDIQIGNDICVHVTNIAEGDYQRISLYNGWNKSDLLPGGEYFFQPGDAASSEDPFIKKFRVTGCMKQQLGTHNLLVRGSYYTVTDIYVEEGEPVAEVGVKGYLSVSSAGMATFVLPFNVPSLPDGVKAYDLTNDGSNEIVASEVNALTADQPVLIIAAEGEYEFFGGEGASDDVSAKTGTYPNGALIGTYNSIDPLSENDGVGNYNYVLQKHDDEVAFYQVLDNSCFISSYRAYLSCGYPGNPGNPAPARMRLVFNNENTTTGMESVQQSISTQKILRNGQILIIRDAKTYNTLGQPVNQ